MIPVVLRAIIVICFLSSVECYFRFAPLLLLREGYTIGCVSWLFFASSTGNFLSTWFFHKWNKNIGPFRVFVISVSMVVCIALFQFSIKNLLLSFVFFISFGFFGNLGFLFLQKIFHTVINHNADRIFTTFQGLGRVFAGLLMLTGYVPTILTVQFLCSLVVCSLIEPKKELTPSKKKPDIISVLKHYKIPLFGTFLYMLTDVIVSSYMIFILQYFGFTTTLVPVGLTVFNLGKVSLHIPLNFILSEMETKQRILVASCFLLLCLFLTFSLFSYEKVWSYVFLFLLGGGLSIKNCTSKYLKETIREKNQHVDISVSITENQINTFVSFLAFSFGSVLLQFGIKSVFFFVGFCQACLIFVLFFL